MEIYPGSGRKIYRYIQQIGRHPQELQQMLLTQSHPEHIGPLKGLSQTTGAVITVHSADTRHRKEDGDPWLHYPGQPITLPGSLPFLHRIPAHRFLEDGQVLPVLEELQALHTPGHTSGSVCFYLQQQGVLFTGDTLLADGHVSGGQGIPRDKLPRLPGIGGAVGPADLRHCLRGPRHSVTARWVHPSPGNVGALRMDDPQVDTT